MATGIDRDLEALVHDFMRQEQCAVGVALHIVTQVARFIGASEVDTLLGVLRTIEAETVAMPGEFAGEGLRRARILRCLYDCFVVSGTPAGHAACAAILANVAAVTQPTSAGH